MIASRRPTEGELQQRLPVSVDVFEHVLSRPEDSPDAMRHPLIVRLGAREYPRLETLASAHGVLIVDEIERQIHDLSQVRFPGGSPETWRAFREDMHDRHDGLAYAGNWIFLPWQGTLVHLLGEEDYYAVRTDRNRDKITVAEQARLRSRSVGVVGLSLGAEVAAAIAQEHLCGHIALADFDRLDLSNLNRLNAGFDDLGLLKTTVAARRIARIDPYLKVTLYDDGVTEQNAGHFLAGLDLLVDECDGMSVKYHLRVLARKIGLNVVFAGDERGFLSVEPYARRPDLDVFHGLLDHPQRARSEYESPREFLMDLTTWLGGWDAVSARTKNSLSQIGERRCGFPQLASEARFAAGQVGQVARRLLLGEPVAPFLGHIDLDQQVPNEG